jgi:hypothetical protein
MYLWLPLQEIIQGIFANPEGIPNLLGFQVAGSNSRKNIFF